MTKKTTKKELILLIKKYTSDIGQVLIPFFSDCVVFVFESGFGCCGFKGV
ncbi:hypothetical protein J5A66_07205 [Prevotella sp. oral taxon 475]|nr:hypothetical protein [Prevotella sp. oral taxon 475]QUB46766.1 hypothetical protein J5A66_07205 [Prevotella sp. oral taxon 475]